MDSRIVIKIISQDGWFKVRVSGDHWHFKHPTKPGITTVTHPRKDIPIGTLNSIWKQAGLK
jgi:predicted RNA binding protein YcfA (HicA-like mRNA interferase family)